MSELMAITAGPGGVLVLLGGVLLFCAFLVRSRWRMHLLAAAAAFTGLVWAILDASVAWQVVCGLFLLTNAGKMAIIHHGSRQGSMTAEERALIEQVLQVEGPAQQRRLRDVIKWRDAEPGEVLMRQGQAAPPLIYVASGRMAIEHDGLPVGSCGAGDFLGEMSLISGGGASASVKVALASRIAVFDRDGLQRLAGGLPDLARALDRAFTQGLAAKIERMNRASVAAGVER